MPYLLLVLATIFWGGNYVVGKILVFHLPPVLIAEIRWTLVAILLVALYHRKVKNDWQEIKGSLRSLSFLALFGQVLFPLNLYIGLQYTTPLNAAIFLSATPSMVLLINKFIFKDVISKANVLGVLLSTGGVLYLLVASSFQQRSQVGFLNEGDLWAIGSAICWAFYCSFLRIKNKKISGNSFVTMCAVLGACFLIPIVLLSGSLSVTEVGAIHLNFTIIAGMFYSVVFPSWLSYLFWSKGIGEIGATRGEIYTHLIPLFGGIFSIWFLGNKLHMYHLISAVLIFSGIYFCSIHEQLKKKRLTFRS